MPSTRTRANPVVPAIPGYRGRARGAGVGQPFRGADSLRLQPPIRWCRRSRAIGAVSASSGCSRPSARPWHRTAVERCRCLLRAHGPIRRAGDPRLSRPSARRGHRTAFQGRGQPAPAAANPVVPTIPGYRGRFRKQRLLATERETLASAVVERCRCLLRVHGPIRPCRRSPAIAAEREARASDGR